MSKIKKVWKKYLKASEKADNLLCEYDKLQEKRMKKKQKTSKTKSKEQGDFMGYNAESTTLTAKGGVTKQKVGPMNKAKKAIKKVAKKTVKKVTKKVAKKKAIKKVAKK